MEFVNARTTTIASRRARRLPASRPSHLSRLVMLVACAMLLALSSAAVHAPSASAAEELTAQRSDAPPQQPWQGPINTLAHAYQENDFDREEEVWRKVGRIRITTDIHNPQVFVGYWASVDVQVIANNVVIKTFSNVPMACGVGDFLGCPSDQVYDRIEPLPLKYLKQADRLRIVHTQLPGRP